MVEFSLVPALAAGLAGAVVMTAMMQMASTVGMTRMPSMALIQGAIVTGDESKATVMGLVTHVLVMGTLVFGSLYVVLFVAFDSNGWVTGLLIGVVHGIVAGVAMVMMGVMHPRIEPPSALPEGTATTTIAGEVRIAEPGLFAKNYGSMTPVGLLVGHALYGVVVALIYGALA